MKKKGKRKEKNRDEKNRTIHMRNRNYIRNKRIRILDT